MSIVDEIEQEIYRYTMRTGDAPDVVAVTPKKFDALRDELGMKHLSYVPTPLVCGVPIVSDSWALGVHAYNHKIGYRPKSQEMMYGACECGSKNAVGRGHSTWCPFYRPA